VLALSGGDRRDEACGLLVKDPSMIASSSRALLEGLSDEQTDQQFNAQLRTSIAQIFRASVEKSPGGLRSENATAVSTGPRSAIASAAALVEVEDSGGGRRSSPAA
jgi:hypothetical protein